MSVFTSDKPSAVITRRFLIPGVAFAGFVAFDEWMKKGDGKPKGKKGAAARRRGSRNAPTTNQRRQMGPGKMALPWSKASATYRRAHPQLGGIGGYPMDTIKRARAARSYAVKELNAGKLTQADVRTIFARTHKRWGLGELVALERKVKGTGRHVAAARGRRAEGSTDVITIYGPTKLHVGRDGYSKDGRYFGYAPQHGHVYEYEVEDPRDTRPRFRGIRAHSVADARAQIRAEYRQRSIKFVKG